MLTWPLSTGLNLGWQATPFQKATLQYQFRFDGYVSDRTTAEDFDVPSSTITNGIGGAWEYRRGGYSLLLNGTWFGRATWEPWGFRQPGSCRGDDVAPDVREVPGRTVARFLSQPVPEDSLERRVVRRARPGSVRRSTSSACSTTRGFTACRRPASASASWRWRAASYSINIFEQYRFDLFLEQAWGRDEPGRGDWQPLSGIGVAVNLRAPWNTILRADLGKSLLPARYGPLGSTTLQIMLLKPLR